MKAKAHKAQQRSSPKVTGRHETCDPGRSVQVGLSYLVNLLNTPVVTYRPPEELKGHSWDVVIRLGV